MKPEFNQGDNVIVEGFHGHGKVISIEPINEVYKIELYFPEKGKPLNLLYPLTKITRIPGVLEKLKNFDFDPSYKYNLFMDAMRLSLAHQYDPFFSLSVTRIDVLPHQMEDVYKVLGALEQKFLLAHDTGLGKTIIAGMIMKELEARSRASRVLLIVPAPLQKQWVHQLHPPHFLIHNAQ